MQPFQYRSYLIDEGRPQFEQSYKYVRKLMDDLHEEVRLLVHSHARPLCIFPVLRRLVQYLIASSLCGVRIKPRVAYEQVRPPEHTHEYHEWARVNMNLVVGTYPRVIDHLFSHYNVWQLYVRLCCVDGVYESIDKSRLTLRRMLEAEYDYLLSTRQQSECLPAESSDYDGDARLFVHDVFTGYDLTDSKLCEGLRVVVVNRCLTRLYHEYASLSQLEPETSRAIFFKRLNWLRHDRFMGSLDGADKKSMITSFAGGRRDSDGYDRRCDVSWRDIIWLNVNLHQSFHDLYDAYQLDGIPDVLVRFAPVTVPVVSSDDWSDELPEEVW